jgi:hypothetical protein
LNEPSGVVPANSTGLSDQWNEKQLIHMKLGKILSITILRQEPIKSIVDSEEQIIWSIVQSVIDKKEANIVFKLYVAKALIIRGDQIGFTFLISMIKDPNYSSQIL